MSRLECLLCTFASAPPIRRTLRPGEEHKVDLRIAVGDTPECRPVGWPFVLNSVGVYEFKVAYYDTSGADPNGRLESAPYPVEVVPTPAEEQGAAAAYTSLLAWVAQFRDGIDYMTPNAARAAADFIERFPDSRYATPLKEGLRSSLYFKVTRHEATEEEGAIYEKLFVQNADTTPPLLSLNASPSSLWPPNHKMVPITVSVDASDSQDSSLDVKLESIICDDQCDAGKDISGAELGTDDREFELRAERLGSGVGRTYTAQYSAADSAGNKTIARTTVLVPHDQGKGKGAR